MKTQSDRTYYKLINSPLGWLGIAWSDKGVVKLQLPEKDKQSTEKKLKSSLPDAAFDAKGFEFVGRLEKLLERYFKGEKVSFATIPIDLRVTEFQQKVYLTLKKLRYGNFITYNDLGEKIGAKNSARAIGMVMGKNPIPLVIPCHRVVSSSKKSLGGFTAYGGVNTKKKLLALENLTDLIGRQ